jgi:D-sedoheptulose 7-phosphate isomerase
MAREGTTTTTTENPQAKLADWMSDYVAKQKAALESIDLAAVGRLTERLTRAVAEDRQIFVFGNGGSAANASHFATDLGKGSSDKIGRRFRVLSVNDNVSWITALGNDYAYEDVYVRQLENYARPGDFVLVMSVSGNSPNVVKAVEWAREHGVFTAALVGAKRGRLAEIADEAIVIDSAHYGRAEDCHMAICHMLCYAFMELPEIAKA